MEKRSARLSLPLIAGALLLSTSAFNAAWATPYPSPTKRFMRDSVTICDQGSFFVGGVIKSTKYQSSSTPSANYSTVMVGQMYVQFQIPSKTTSYPIIMISGGGHTGASLESTPNGDEGWAPYALRHNYPVFLVDQAGRGRSGFDATVIHEGKGKLLAGDSSGINLIPTFLAFGPSPAWTAWFGRLVLPGTCTATTDITAGDLVPHGAPQCASVGDTTPVQFPIHSSTPPLQPNLTLNYSNSGEWGPAPRGPAEYYNLDYYRQIVPNAEVTLPTGICASCNPQNLSGAFGSSQVWTSTDLAELVRNLGINYGGAIVVTHSQSGPIGHHLIRILKEQNALQYLKGLVTVEGTSCSLPAAGVVPADLDNIPYMVLKGFYSATNASCTDTVNALIARRQAGQGTAAVEYVQLDQAPAQSLAWPSPLNRPIMPGITHMMMDGSDEGLGHDAIAVMDVILNWGNAHFPKLARATSCPAPGGGNR